jgi:hypothetical protein
MRNELPASLASIIFPDTCFYSSALVAKAFLTVLTRCKVEQLPFMLKASSTVRVKPIPAQTYTRTQKPLST